MKPKPFAALKNLTVPVVIMGSFQGASRKPHLAAARTAYIAHIVRIGLIKSAFRSIGATPDMCLHTHCIWGCIAPVTTGIAASKFALYQWGARANNSGTFALSRCRDRLTQESATPRYEAQLPSSNAYVRFGSTSEVRAIGRHVCCTPEN